MGMTTQQILSALAAPFAAEDVRWRVGAKSPDKTSGLALAYMDARLAEERLDEVLGANWQCKYSELRNGAKGGQDSSPSIIVCEIGLKLDGEWIWRANGAGDTDYEAEKGAMSDAFKRAATKWGIGRYLYGFPSPWVHIKPQGKSFVIARDELPKLRALAAKALADFRADPKGFRAPDEDEAPVRPGFTPAAAPPQRPEPAPRPASHGPIDANVVRSPAALRAHLDAGKLLDGASYVAAIRTMLDAAKTGEDVDFLVAILRAHPPPSGHGLNGDVAAARRRVTEAAS